jgi:hypothetical protein
MQRKEERKRMELIIITIIIIPKQFSPPRQAGKVVSPGTLHVFKEDEGLSSS